MTNRDRAELQVAAVIGAVLGGVTGYLLSYLVESGGWLKILIWALIGAVFVTGMVFCLRASPREAPASQMNQNWFCE
jgi:high-affinity Fe2+/Pb2+ permease